MKQTTLCYIEENGAYLMLHRNKKENDENKDKWIGIGGKLEEAETPFECVVREVKEEVGITPNNLKYRGIITFVSDIRYGIYAPFFRFGLFRQAEYRLQGRGT